MYNNKADKRALVNAVQTVKVQFLKYLPSCLNMGGVAN